MAIRNLNFKKKYCVRALARALHEMHEDKSIGYQCTEKSTKNFMETRSVENKENINRVKLFWDTLPWIINSL